MSYLTILEDSEIVVPCREKCPHSDRHFSRSSMLLLGYFSAVAVGILLAFSKEYQVEAVYQKEYQGAPEYKQHTIH